ncbi:MAG: putative toxin-antitoxin system toxin component, PIN family [Rhodoferax sp.]|nr:putative toxin-antitoxin system toxin component, PIN family [Rhodoferax sp.]MDD5332302.1 putative toxin-antitoxin system toxin component, PIN family [Rhodoferax sp.]
MATEVHTIVLDTNIVLDLLVFDDPAVQALKLALAAGAVRWLATAPMREELLRVLDYPKIKARLALQQLDAAQVLRQFDAQARLVDVATRTKPTCSDPDDQKFIDLAVAHQTTLLSKDHAVLCLKKRLLTLAVKAQTVL